MKESKPYKRRQTVWPLRAAIDLGMGVLYMAIPIVAVQTNYIIEQFGRTKVYAFAALFAAYGLFRIIRGILALRQN